MTWSVVQNELIAKLPAAIFHTFRWSCLVKYPGDVWLREREAVRAGGRYCRAKHLDVAAAADRLSHCHVQSVLGDGKFNLGVLPLAARGHVVRCHIRAS